MILLLFILVLALLLISLYYYGYEIIAPPVIICAVYTFSIYAAMYNIESWHIKLSNITVLYIVVGLLSFCLSSFIVRTHYKNKPVPIKRAFVINITNQKTIILYLIIFICAYIYIQEVSHIVGGYGGDYETAMADFRSDFSYGDENLSFIANQSYKVLTVITFICLYIYCNNTIATGQWKKYIIWLVPVIILGYATIRSGSRAPLIQLFVMFIVFLLLFQQQYGKYKKKALLKYILYIVGFSILFLVMFSAIRYLVGRQNDSNIVDYISMYVGGSIQLFDLYLKHPNEAMNNNTEVFGALYNNLIKLGFIDDKELIMHKEFRYSNGILLGNVYTSFRAFHHDFGFTGIIIFQVIEGFFYSIYYEKMKRLKNKSGISATFILYGMLMMPLFEHAIQEQLFSNYLCLNTFILLLLTIIIIHYLKPKLYATKSF